MSLDKEQGKSVSPMTGLMQDWPLTVDRFLTHAARYHGHRTIVSRREDGELERIDYAALYKNAKRISRVLTKLGLGLGDISATLAMNSAEHLATWYGICGIGAVCHTLNPRLFHEQLRFIINHARDSVIFADGRFAPLLADVLPTCPTVRQVIFLSAPITNVSCVPSACLSGLIADCDEDIAWGEFDDRIAAGLCYTSGTTGQPKGVLYSHKSNYLHAILTLQPDVFGLSVRDTVLPAVPLYHANAWAVAFSAPAVGANLVMPGSRLDGKSLYELIEQENVTVALGVPSVWLSLLEFVEANGLNFPSLERVIVGGAASSQRIVNGFARLAVNAIHSWGMTELSPVGVAGSLTPEIAKLPLDQQMGWRLKQGRPPIGVELEIFGENGQPLPHDGRSVGRVMVKGPSVASGYFRLEGSSLEDNGWFDTGDIATIDSLGYLKITDRAKDVIKSGGEWISSLDIENAALLHPSVSAAAAIGVTHQHWGERPILYVQPKPGATIDAEEIREFLTGHLAKWCVPDSVHAIETLPLGATGKVDKKRLRTMRAESGAA
jgi:fatty-acyl-CoA synthase